MTDPSHLCQCSCGAVRIAVRSAPLFRVLCHCTICQSFNSKPFADVTVFRAKGVDLPKDNTVEFRTYRPPPAVQRGKCSTCGGAAIELAAMPKLVIIPSANFNDTAFLPAPAMHIFYDRRVADIDDHLPKYSGYWRSEMAFFGRLFASLLRR